MPYTINKTNGDVFATVSDGTVNTSSSITIIGKNYAGYGEYLGENFIKLLESSANTTAPTAPLTGQLWFNSATSSVSGISSKTLAVYDGSSWKALGSARVSATTPSSGNQTGDLWFDSTNSQLKVYDGASYILVGPSYSSAGGLGTSGAVVESVSDGVTDHVVVKLIVDNTVVATVSKDAAFVPSVGISGFATIKPGVQVSTTVTNALFQGTATDAQLLDGIDSTGFLSATANDSTAGTLTVANDTGLYVGEDSDFHVSVSGTDVLVANASNNGDVILKVNTASTPTNVLVLDGATSNVLPGVGGTTNIGASGNTFNTVYATTFSGTASQAKYADLAERFAADDVYEAGTVVELGGLAEVTKAVNDLSENVFGVISTQAAYLMNATAGSNETHPAIAMNGRVPVKVIGRVAKGDRLVSAGNGFARTAQPGEATSFNVIGRSLETKVTEGEGTVEAIVKVN
jgi:hypothetical protein